MLTSVSYLEFGLVLYDKCGSIFIIPCTAGLFNQHYMFKIYFFWCEFLASYQKLRIYRCVDLCLVYVLNFVPLIHMFVSMSKPYSLYCCSDGIQLESRDSDNSSHSFIGQYCFRYTGILCFQEDYTLKFFEAEECPFKIFE